MKKQFIVALIGASFAIAAQADNTYVGVNAGQSEQKIGFDNVSTKESATGYKLYAGYNFDKTFGAEAGYVDFGDADFKDAGDSLTVRTKSFYVAATATLPVNNEFAVFAKAGIARNRVSANLKVGSDTFNGSENRTSAIFGLGASYNVAKNLAVVAEYEYFGKVAKDNGVDVKADLLSIGLHYKF